MIRDPKDRQVPRDIHLAVKEQDLTSVNGWRSGAKSLTLLGLYAVGVLVVVRGLRLGGVGGAALLAGAWALMGLSLSSAVFAYHEATHGALFRGRRRNAAAGTFWSCVVLTSYASYLHSHREHHRRTNVPGDPQEFKEFDSVVDYVLFVVFASTFYSAVLWGRAAGTAVGKGPAYMRRHRRKVVVDLALTSSVVAGAVGLTVAFPLAMLAFYWIPFLIQAVVVTPLVNIPEHYGLPKGQLSALTTTRTTTTTRVLHFFLWHNNFHAEHHMHPGIPSHNLPLVHDLLGDRVITEASYLRWHLALIKSCTRSARRRPAPAAPVLPGGPTPQDREDDPEALVTPAGQSVPEAVRVPVAG